MLAETAVEASVHTETTQERWHKKRMYVALSRLYKSEQVSEREVYVGGVTSDGIDRRRKGGFLLAELRIRIDPRRSHLFIHLKQHVKNDATQKGALLPYRVYTSHLCTKNSLSGMAPSKKEVYSLIIVYSF